MTSSSSSVTSSSNLSGKVVLITGASSGIGAGTALHFASIGCKLSLVARNAQALEAVAVDCRKAGAMEVIVKSKDLSEEEQCREAVQDTVDQYKSLDVMVNSAGILMGGSIETLTLEDYDKVMNINTRSALVLTQSAIPHLVLTRGNIVHVSSVTGLRAFPSVLGYCMSKAALDMLVRVVALEVADRGVRVNAVNPGVIVTPCHRNSGMEEEEYHKFLEKCKETHALGRPGTVREVAETVAFLAGEAATFITGQTIAIDGGRSIMCPR